MIFQRANGYMVFKERPDFYSAGLGVFMGEAGEGGSGPPDNFTLFDRTGDIIQDRATSDIETRA